MDFSAEQHYDAGATRVAALYADADFHASLGAGPRIGPPEVVGRTVDGDVVELAIRYRFTAELPSAARRFVEADKLTWVERTRIDLVRCTSASRLEADHYASLLQASAETRCVDEPDGSRRRVTGRLAVKVPLVGGRVERAIVDGLREHLALEREAAARALAG